MIEILFLGLALSQSLDPYQSTERALPHAGRVWISSISDARTRRSWTPEGRLLSKFEGHSSQSPRLQVRFKLDRALVQTHPTIYARFVGAKRQPTDQILPGRPVYLRIHPLKGGAGEITTEIPPYRKNADFFLHISLMQNLRKVSTIEVSDGKLLKVQGDQFKPRIEDALPQTWAPNEKPPIVVLRRMPVTHEITDYRVKIFDQRNHLLRMVSAAHINSGRPTNEDGYYVLRGTSNSIKRIEIWATFYYYVHFTNVSTHPNP